MDAAKIWNNAQMEIKNAISLPMATKPSELTAKNSLFKYQGKLINIDLF